MMGWWTPKVQKNLHYVLAVVWLLTFPLVMLLGLEGSIPLLVFISIYANVAGHWSSGQAAASEYRQEQEEERQARLESKLDDANSG